MSMWTTLKNPEKRMRDMIGDEKAEEWMKDDGHCAIVDVWRPIEYPVEKDHLGFIDPETFTPEDWHCLKIGRPNRLAVIIGVEQR